MTIKLRETLYRLFFILSIASLLSALLSSLLVINITSIERFRLYFYPEKNIWNFYTMFFTALCIGIFSCVVLAFVSLNSRRTVSLEIFFFALWTLCQSLEISKVFIVIAAIKGAGSNVFDLITRIAMFGRYFGSLALFIGSLFASGLKQDKTVFFVWAILIISLLFATAQPLNSVGPGADLLADRGFPYRIVILDISIALLALVNYLISWYSNKEKVYLHAGFSSFLVQIAVLLIKSCDLPWLSLLLLPLLAFGAYNFITNLHSYYLWR